MTSQWKYRDTSTDSVCNSFLQLRSDKKAALREFWAWYERTAERERLAERERIIKLLEETPTENWFDRGFKQHLIALIKGENK